MSIDYLRSFIIELKASNRSRLTKGSFQRGQGLFLSLVQQSSEDLFTRLHDERNYRPYTVSPVKYVATQGFKSKDESLSALRFRVTVFDGGEIWDTISTKPLEGKVKLYLGESEVIISRIISVSSSDPTGWASFTTWEALADNKDVPDTITFNFITPTAFSLGDRKFCLFPEPLLVWTSLTRVWNKYAPTQYRVNRQVLEDFIKMNLAVRDPNLEVRTLHYASSFQKGFTGTCTYAIYNNSECSRQIIGLAEFARYAGVGSKTTMGMGQTQPELNTIQKL